MQNKTMRKRLGKKQNKPMRSYVVDFLKVIDYTDFDPDKLADAFPQIEKLHSATEIALKCRMTKQTLMKKLDSILHPSVRIFEQDNLFFLREPLAPEPRVAGRGFRRKCGCLLR